MHDLSQDLENKVISITGGSGYIGSSLINKLINYPVKKIIRISRKEQKYQDNIEDLTLNLNEYRSWFEIVKNSDIIFHLSGNTSIKDADKNPSNSLISETLPIDHLVKASKELNRNPRVVYSSTATIYGLTDVLPVEENITPLPITKYDYNKLEVEKKLEIASQNNFINAIVLRLANVYGPSPVDCLAQDRGVLTRITRLCFENKKIPLYGSGNYIRDYVYIDDVINALILSSLMNYEEISKSARIAFNVSTGIGTNVRTVFEMIAKEVMILTGKKIMLENVAWPIQISDIEKRNYIGSAERLKSFAGWNAKTSIEDGICNLVHHLSKDYL